MTATLQRRLRENLKLLNQDLYKFVPRPDRPEVQDQQTSTYYSKAKVTFARGGTGSGKTEVMAQKVARFITQIQAPPRKDTPFVVISDTYEQVANICWKEKLCRIIPQHLIDWERCRWNNRAANWPYVVVLRPWPDDPDKNWVLEFHSLDQSRRAFQGRSFGGFWFSEQFEWDVFDEVVGRCRDTWYDGAHVCEFTPIDPDLAIGYEEKMSDPPEGWVEYRLNMCENQYISKEWVESYLGSLSEDYKEVRRTGEMLHLAGAIYPNFSPSVHALNDRQWNDLTGSMLPARGCSIHEWRRGVPINIFFRRGIDWGESKDHPFVCLWGWKDGGGTWFIYDEYVEDTGRVLYPERILEIKERWPWLDTDPHYGMAYADPSRPMNISEFTNAGILTTMASNAVLEGIDYCKRMIQINHVSGRPQVYIHRGNCPRLIRSLRKYRWKWSVKPGKTDLRVNPTAPKLEPLKYLDDEADAFRYMLYSDRTRDGKGPGSMSTSGDPARYGLHLRGSIKGRGS